MKRNEIKALHQLKIADLQKKLSELVLQVAKSKLEKKVGRLTNRRVVASVSDDIARIKTVLREKEMEKTV